MERKSFLRSLVIGAISTPVLVQACKKDAAATTGEATNTGSVSGDCSVAPTETAGPFPTKSPSGLVRSDITDGREGYPLTIRITINNINNSCAALAGAIVDIWHCDADGAYSEYGGGGMQSSNYQSVHFLRGRQTTDANGLVTFTSIFPGWYNGRATHIHMHIYNSAGNSLKITQIAFPEGSGSAVSLVNGYGKGLSGYTYNKSDNVFSDDSAGIEIAKVTGSISEGFILEKQVNVPA